MYKSNNVLCIRLPCGKIINGRFGNKRDMTQRVVLHKKVCILCCNININDLSGTPDKHFSSLNDTLRLPEYISSYMEKNY